MLFLGKQVNRSNQRIPASRDRTIAAARFATCNLAARGIDAMHNPNFADLGMFDRISEFRSENNSPQRTQRKKLCAFCVLRGLIFILIGERSSCYLM